ncbi:5'-methylthioadenosine/S-adenosylhomocysteine nucleosidase [Gleimia sp. 6138-11-ORH1]|uniref:5'-methylthioadenosine/S-adenosylhomocysteine nucleosidase n=1 Tax=Gleimia sp. 6138-11-ORH1 TaxID=2973937 RepID=UPI00216A40DC|nr:5'-methylthioadenosine/S-adenosylhomocysteine nucleosidase [Gleimia sp. 6138-11-ORH1]MCS4485105.1 5'-methylthioadenosine/S-adenosylhomocysteine nucleosidase [Gleimia sp. 6138-11-ORH1]
MKFPQFKFETPAVTVIVAAMELELAPFLQATKVRQSFLVANQEFHLGTWLGREVLLVRSGIGLVNAATAASRALSFVSAGSSAVAGYLCVGTCGGLAASVRVRDAIVGSSFIFSRADATAFGYAPGQVPGLPVDFPATLEVLPNLSKVSADSEFPRVLVGAVASSDAFVTEANVEDTRERFPAVLGVDMESAAAAQVCFLSEVPFVSARGVSDLCGPAAGQDFHIAAEEAALVSFRTVSKLLG